MACRFILIASEISAQQYVLKNQEVLEKVNHGLDSLYNYNFEFSDSMLKEFLQDHPDHPFPYLYEALTIYLKNFPIIPKSETDKQYVIAITRAIEKADILLKNDEENPEAIFLSLMGRLLIMQYYADNDLSSKVVPYVRKSYKLTKLGFKLTEKVIDFNFSTGLYNYYRQAYPEKHPVYKPIAYFFADGNKELGIKQLEHNSQNGTFLNAESLAFLVYISLYFEGDPNKAEKYTKQLHKKYPNNPIYTSYRIQALLLQKKYVKVVPLIKKLQRHQHNNDFFEMMMLIYSGIIEEMQNENFEQAEIFYKIAITKSEKYGSYGERSAAYAYFGLSRIHKLKDKKQSAAYRNKAIDSTNNPHLTFE